MTNQKIKDLAQEKLKELGINVKNEDLPEVDNTNHVLKNINIDVKSLGLFQYPFEDINLDVNVGLYDNPHKGIVIRFHYKWEHISGSNGYSVSFRYRENEDKWTIYNW